MKNYLLIIILVLSIQLTAEVSGKAPDFELQDAEGNMVRLSEMNDKLVLLDFWASWCVPCKKALPHLSSFQDKYKEKLVVITINIDKPRHKEKAKAYIKSNGYSFVNLYDPQQTTMKLFNVVNPPRTILIAPGGDIVYTHDGYKRGDEAEIDEHIREWLDKKVESDVERAETVMPFTISGMNKMKYVYRSVADSLHHYLDNELTFNAGYKNFRFGMTYKAELPEYDRFAPEEELKSDKIKQDWLERYAEFTSESLYLRLGNYETVFGSGMVIHAYNNTDMNDDKRLDGVQLKLNKKGFNVQAVYGSLANEVYTDKNDIVTGLDLTGKLTDYLTLGGSALSYRSYINTEENEYNQRDVWDGRLLFTMKWLDLNLEYAESLQYRDVIPEQTGSALYGNINLYLPGLRLTAAAKDYKHFEARLSELPTVNHSEEPIAEYGAWSLPGYDEEGVQGIVSWKPLKETEIEINYAEGWSEDESIKQSDFYSHWKQELDGLSLNFEYKQTERIDESGEEYRWDKAMTPSLEADFMIKGKPVLAKIEWKKQEYDNYGNEHGYNEPTFQLDYGFYKNFSISLLSSLKYNEEDDISAAEGKIGVELFAPLWEHTDIRLFAGSEKGGKVCRNGVCNYQAPFDGIRLELNTRF